MRDGLRRRGAGSRASWLAGLGLSGLLAALAGPLEARARELVVAHTNDLHGWVMPRPFTGEQLPAEAIGMPLGGLASAATRVAALRAEAGAGNVLFLDAGDWASGTLYDRATQGEVVARMLADPRLGLSATVFGNHAWDHGHEPLMRFLGILEGKVPVLTANVAYHGARPRGVQPWRVFPVAGLRVAVIGLVTGGALQAAHGDGTHGWTVEDDLTILKRLLPEMRAQADYVIAVTHMGFGRDPKKRAALAALDDSDPGLNVDLVVDGHSHRDESYPADDDTWVVQADHYGVKLGIVRVPLDEHGRPGRPVTERVVLDARRIPPDRGMTRRYRAEMAAAARMEGERIVEADPGVRLPHRLRHDPGHHSVIGQAMASAFVAAASGEGKAADLGLAYHPGTRAGVYATDGWITAGSLHAVSPFGGEVFRIEVPGKVLAPVLERGVSLRGRMSYAGARVTARAAGGDLEFVTAEIGGAPFDPARKYAVACDEFMAGWFKGEGVAKQGLGIEPKEALRRWLAGLAGGRRLTQRAVDARTSPSITVLGEAGGKAPGPAAARRRK